MLFLPSPNMFVDEYALFFFYFNACKAVNEHDRDRQTPTELLNSCGIYISTLNAFYRACTSGCGFLIGRTNLL